MSYIVMPPKKRPAPSTSESSASESLPRRVSARLASLESRSSSVSGRTRLQRRSILELADAHQWDELQRQFNSCEELDEQLEQTKYDGRQVGVNTVLILALRKQFDLLDILIRTRKVTTRQLDAQISESCLQGGMCLLGVLIKESRWSSVLSLLKQNVITAEHLSHAQTYSANLLQRIASFSQWELILRFLNQGFVTDSEQLYDKGKSGREYSVVEYAALGKQ